MAALVGLGLVSGILASPGEAGRAATAPATDDGGRVGMTSCAARGCHGAVAPVDPGHGDVFIKDGAYTTWLNFDPHARAYDALLDPRSERIAANLKTALGGKPAHEAGLCLSCHATVGPPDPVRPGVAPLSDGISCESCHGAAGGWQDKHLSGDWLKLSPVDKAKDGLTDLSTPTSRARTCVACHVGDRSRGMDMNHDLIAAGHPRLNFEFASYQAAYPKHWKERHEKTKPVGPVDFEMKSWAIGQVVTAKAVLELLGARAIATKSDARKAPAPEAIWPEFAEYECFACHHGLTNPSPFQGEEHLRNVAKPGRLSWGTWPLAMLPELAKGHKEVDLATPESDWGKLLKEMDRTVPDPDKVAALAKGGVVQLDALLGLLEKETYDPARVAALLKEWAAPPAGASGWDRLAQHDMALMALGRTARDQGVAIGPEVEKALKEAETLLQFPPKYDSPRNVSPAPSSPKP